MPRVNKSSSHHVFIREYLEALDCARSLTVWLLYENKEHTQLVELAFDPLSYNDCEAAKHSLAATSLLSKADFLDLQLDRRAVALEKFRAAERNCAETNRRVKASAFKHADTGSIIVSMKNLIADTLGSFCPEAFVDACNFGPGATTFVPRRQAVAPYKFDFENRISLEAYDFVAPWFNAAYPSWDVQFVLEGGSKIVTVPKNAKTDRTIAIEPGMNLWFQKGIGVLIRRALKGAGIDLNDQSINQERSRIASKFNKLATVDFSAASDTISRAVVFELLPVRWYTILDIFRSKYGSIDGTPVTFEKFSSMGNGFTFELETLLFWSLAVACCKRMGLSTSGVSVYGDDVIIPVGAIDLYRSVAEDLGFTVNKEKSYSSSYYRESCGAHWWCGSCIKPIFLKETLYGKAQAIKLANSLRSFSRIRNSYGCDGRFFDCYRNLTAPLTGVSRIPVGYGDVGLIENFDHPSVSAIRAGHGVEGFHVKCWVPSPVLTTFKSKGLLLSKLKANGDRSLQWWKHQFRPDLAGIGNDLPIPIRTKQARIRLLIPEWTNVGPWVFL